MTEDLFASYIITRMQLKKRGAFHSDRNKVRNELNYVKLISLLVKGLGDRVSQVGFFENGEI